MALLLLGTCLLSSATSAPQSTPEQDRQRFIEFFAQRFAGVPLRAYVYGAMIANPDAREQYEKGRLSFTLHGERMKGKWHLVRTRAGKADERSWLLFKSKDEEALEDSEDALVQRHRRSVQSGRSVEEIGEGVQPRDQSGPPALGGGEAPLGAPGCGLEEVERLEDQGVLGAQDLGWRLHGCGTRQWITRARLR